MVTDPTLLRPAGRAQGQGGRQGQAGGEGGRQGEGEEGMNTEDTATLIEAAELIEAEAAIYMECNLADGGDWIDEEDEVHYNRLMGVAERLRAIAEAEA